MSREPADAASAGRGGRWAPISAACLFAQILIPAHATSGWQRAALFEAGRPAKPHGVLEWAQFWFESLTVRPLLAAALGLLLLWLSRRADPTTRGAGYLLCGLAACGVGAIDGIWIGMGGIPTVGLIFAWIIAAGVRLTDFDGCRAMARSLTRAGALGLAAVALAMAVASAGAPPGSGNATWCAVMGSYAAIGAWVVLSPSAFPAWVAGAWARAAVVSQPVWWTLVIVSPLNIGRPADATDILGLALTITGTSLTAVPCLVLAPLGLATLLGRRPPLRGAPPGDGAR